MTNTSHSDTGGATSTGISADADVVFDVLSDSRRRFVLARLRAAAAPTTLSDLAEELAAREHDAERGVPESEIHSVHASLYHRHIPKMADAELVEYSRESGAVRLSADGESLASAADLPSIEE